MRACQATLPPNLLNKAWGRPPTCHASTRHCLRGGPRGGAGEGQGEGGCGGKVLRALRGHSMPPVLIRRALIMCLSACVSIWQSVHPSILLVFLPYFYVFFCPLVYPSFLLPTGLSMVTGEQPWGMQGEAAASQARGSEPPWLVLWALGKGLDDAGSGSPTWGGAGLGGVWETLTGGRPPCAGRRRT